MGFLGSGAARVGCRHLLLTSLVEVWGYDGIASYLPLVSRYGPLKAAVAGDMPST